METWMIGPVVQYGFIGFSAVLLGVVVWLIRQLLVVLEANSRVIADNTEAIRKLTAMTDDLLDRTRTLHDKMLCRPCIALKEI